MNEIVPAPHVPVSAVACVPCALGDVFHFPDFPVLAGIADTLVTAGAVASACYLFGIVPSNVFPLITIFYCSYLN